MSKSTLTIEYLRLQYFRSFSLFLRCWDGLNGEKKSHATLPRVKSERNYFMNKYDPGYLVST